MKSQFRVATLAVAFAVAGTLMGATPAAAQANCDRATLQDIANRYDQAQEQGSIFALPVGEWVDYRENGQLVSTATGVISQPAKFAWTVDVIDTKACRVVVQGVLTEPTPYVVTTRLASTFNGLGQINSIVTKQGDAGFDARKTMDFANNEDWGDIPADKRDSREVLLAVATAYVGRLGGGTGELPMATDCNLLDNGLLTQGCAPAGGPALVDAEFTVDVDKGAVAVLSRRGTEDGTPDARILRIEGGQLRHVHAVVPSN